MRRGAMSEECNSKLLQNNGASHLHHCLPKTEDQCPTQCPDSSMNKKPLPSIINVQDMQMQHGMSKFTAQNRTRHEAVLSNYHWKSMTLKEKIRDQEKGRDIAMGS